jgi:hypothetical protein
MIALTIILCIFLALLLTPRQSYPWAIAVAVPVYAWLCWIITRPLPISSNWGAVDRFIIWVALFLSIIPALLRLMFVRQGVEDSPSEIDWKPVQVSSLFVIIWGGAWLLTPAVPALVGAATCIVIGLLISVAMFGIARRMPRQRVIFVTAGTALITGAIAVLIWPLAVVLAAEQRAAGRPYCLMVAQGIDYRTANNLLDLTPLIMRGQEGRRSAANYHGELLISGEANRNWSYEQVDFFDKSRDNKPPTCVTAVGFARNLPWL